MTNCILNSLSDFYILCNKSGYFSYPINYSTFENTDRFILKDDDSANKYIDAMNNTVIKDGLSGGIYDFIVIVPNSNGRLIPNHLFNLYNFPRGITYDLIDNRPPITRLKIYYNDDADRIDVIPNY